MSKLPIVNGARKYFQFIWVVIIFIPLFVVFTISCNQQKEDKPFRCATCDDEMSKNEMADTAHSKGRILFMAKCSSCHNASTKKSAGPGLACVLSRIPSRNWAYAFVRNADSMIKSGDAYSVKIYNENSHAVQTQFPDLSREEIDEILDYCNNGSGCVTYDCR